MIYSPSERVVVLMSLKVLLLCVGPLDICFLSVMFPICFHYKPLMKILQKNCEDPPHIDLRTGGEGMPIFSAPLLFFSAGIIKCKGSFTIYKLPYLLRIRDLLNHSLYLFCFINRWRPFKQCVFKEYNAFRTILMISSSP